MGSSMKKLALIAGLAFLAACGETAPPAAPTELEPTGPSPAVLRLADCAGAVSALAEIDPATPDATNPWEPDFASLIRGLEGEGVEYETRVSLIQEAKTRWQAQTEPTQEEAAMTCRAEFNTRQ